MILRIIALSALLLILAACESTPANTPVPTVDPCPTQAEQVYIDQLEEHINALGYAAGELGTLLIQLGDSPLLLLDDDWIYDAGLAMAALDVVGDTILELEAPPSVASISEVGRQVARLVTEAVDYYAVAIDSLEAADIAEANDLMVRAGVYLDQISPAVLALCEGS